MKLQQVPSITFRIFTVLFLCIAVFENVAQNSTHSPYSRYGLGEMYSQMPAHNTGMGGAHVAWRPDSTMPVFLNTGNPASFSLVRLTTLEVGGRFNYSQFNYSTAHINRSGVNFSYATLGFPVGKRGGICAGIMPYTISGYDSERIEDSPVGSVSTRYAGSGGLSKVFVGYGVMPFQQHWLRVRRRITTRPDSLPPLSARSIRTRHFFARFLSDLTIGGSAQYIFGNIINTTRVIYPNSGLYNHTYFEHTLEANAFTGNFGVITGITIDSVRSGGSRRALKEQVKISFGFTSNLQNPLRVLFSDVSYNYILSATGIEVIRDTVRYLTDQKQAIRLPLEQGFGISIKKGERLNVAADAALTGWSRFAYPGNPAKLSDSYRVSFGLNYVPEKYAAGRGAYLSRVNYRFGVSHETGFIKLKDRMLSNSWISAGVGLPVGIGRLSSMVHVSLQAGVMGTTAQGLLQENYFRVHLGFTFCDRWFQKFRYD